MGRKKLTKKTCPICKIEKPRSDYYEYVAKGRNSKRIDHRCRACSYEYCRPARKRYFERKREMLMERLTPWGRDNKERLREYQYEYNKKAVKELSKSYLNAAFKKLTGLNGNDYPELVLIYKNQLILKRKLNEKSENAPNLN